MSWCIGRLAVSVGVMGQQGCRSLIVVSGSIRGALELAEKLGAQGPAGV